ncbi:hypothetical protein PG994_004047 [Apiospora phragmitis]|uniref:Uncharacterized protein n=1 Tax=Apiospora phragmitis TaxID=2905665 RepID=A0ABR1W2S7_9PEZI
MAFIRSSAADKDDDWQVLDRAGSAATTTTTACKPSKPITSRAKRTSSKKQQKHLSRLQIVYIEAVFYTLVACHKPFLCLRAATRKVLACSDAAVAQAKALGSHLRSVYMSLQSWFCSLCAHAYGLLSPTVFFRIFTFALFAAGFAIGAVGTHALNNGVLNVPQPPACAGPYKQLSVGISAYYNVWGLDESHDNRATPTQSVHYLHRAAADLAARINTTTSPAETTIQLPFTLCLDFPDQILSSSPISFHVHIKCQAGPLTLSRRDHHYLRSGFSWQNLIWRPPVLDPRADSRRPPMAKPVPQRDGGGPHLLMLGY